MRPTLKARELVSGAPIVAFIVAIGEMFLMTTPFAAYFYGLYSPLLGLAHSVPALAWLADFWMPHIVPTTSARLAFGIGVTFASGGIVLFLAHAIYLYWTKFRNKSIATRGLYRFVRHPQYSCLILSGIGFVLLWPRFVNLVLFLAMAGSYYLLGRSEEERMRRRFPFEYLEYAASRPMFVPGGPGSWVRRALSRWIPRGAPQTALLAALIVLVTLAGAFSVRALSLSVLRVIPVAGDPASLVIAYSAATPQAFLDEAARIAELDPERGVRLVLLTDSRKILDHLLIDSGVRKDAVARIDISAGDLYLLRAFVPGAALAGEGLRAGSIRRLDSVYSMRHDAGDVALSRVALPETALYRHAAVPLL